MATWRWGKEEEPHTPVLERINNDAKKLLGEIHKIVRFLMAQEQNSALLHPSLRKWLELGYEQKSYISMKECSKPAGVLPVSSQWQAEESCARDPCGVVVTHDRLAGGGKKETFMKEVKKLQRHENETFKFIIPYV